MCRRWEARCGQSIVVSWSFPVISPFFFRTLRGQNNQLGGGELTYDVNKYNNWDKPCIRLWTVLVESLNRHDWIGLDIPSTSKLSRIRKRNTYSQTTSSLGHQFIQCSHLPITNSAGPSPFHRSKTPGQERLKKGLLPKQVQDLFGQKASIQLGVVQGFAGRGCWLVWMVGCHCRWKMSDLRSLKIHKLSRIVYIHTYPGEAAWAILLIAVQVVVFCVYFPWNLHRKAALDQCIMFCVFRSWREKVAHTCSLN